MRMLTAAFVALSAVALVVGFDEAVVSLDMLGEGSAASSALVSTGSFEMSKLTAVSEELGEGAGSSNAATWVSVSMPVRLKWDGSDSYLETTDATGWGSDECLMFRDEAKVDNFFCDDDPAGEALWLFNDGKLQSFGDPTNCLVATADGGTAFQGCDQVPAEAKWEVPPQTGGYGKLRSVNMNSCAVPVDGQGARKIQMVSCDDTAVTKWKNNELLEGMCTQRWPKDASGKSVYSNVPSRRSCFSTTGREMGKWGHELVLEATAEAGFHTTEGARLLNSRIGADPLTNVADAESCAQKCKDATGCRSFNYDAGVKSCELSTESQATAAPMNFDQGDNATSWTYYEPKTSTVNTKCESNCLPSQVARLDFPTTGAKFGDSQGLLPTAVSDHFDSSIFGGMSDIEQRAECFAKVDAIVIEVKSYCQAAKTVLCAPQATSPSSKEKCDIKKEAQCRRMVVMPITFFGNDNAAWREKCGHGAAEDGKVWHNARVSLDCGTINGLGNLCGDVENLL